MAATQLSKSVASTYLTKLSYGYRPITIDEYDTTAEPEIQPGFVEVNGDVYEFASAEAISGWGAISNSTQAYIYIVPSGTSATAQFSATAPTFSTSKQGWYNGNDRALWAVYKGSAGTTYELKASMPPEQNVRYFSTNNYISGDINIDGNADLDGTLSVAGVTTMANALNVNASLNVSSNIDSGGSINADLGMTVGSGGIATFGGNTFWDRTRINGGLKIDAGQFKTTGSEDYGNLYDYIITTLNIGDRVSAWGNINDGTDDYSVYDVERASSTQCNIYGVNTSNAYVVKAITTSTATSITGFIRW